MTAAFYGDKNVARSGSILTNGVNNIHYGANGQLNTPPRDDYPFVDEPHEATVPSNGVDSSRGADIHSWLEVWDYVGGASFRGFIAEVNGEKSLFAFFDPGVLGRDLKKA